LTGIVSLLARAMRIDVANFFGFQVPPETPKILETIRSGKTRLDDDQGSIL
jgi:hypothetical protein